MPLIPTESPVNFSLLLHARWLIAGRSYQLCIDVDGYGQDNSMEPSNKEVYISGVYAARDVSNGRTVYRQHNQRLWLSCSSGCSNDSMAYIADQCEGFYNSSKASNRSSPVSNFSSDGEEWRIDLDLAALDSSRYYRVCTDLDGFGNDGGAS